MGGLRKLMPITHLSFLIACLAIAGVPPFAGFFSKEEILLAAFQSNKLIYGVALFTAALTAFYMFRLYFSIFWRREAASDAHHGEGTISMKIPLIILSVCAVAAGFVPFSKFITTDGLLLETHIDLIFSIAPVALTIFAILFAAMLYKKESDKPERLAAMFGGLYQAALHKFYVDEVYLFVTKKIVFNLIGRPAAWIDKHVIDGLMNGIAIATRKVSELIKYIQSGAVQSYTLYFFGGVASLAVIFIYLWK
jgi:NADH-quinone oxidoreductase subunit L